MWKLNGPPKTVKITKKLAQTFMEMEAAPHDRPLSERRLQVYERLALAGQFRPINWARVFCTETNQEYRINGKHTSTLFSRLENAPDCFAVIEEYEADTLEDVARLYGSYDSKMQSRTASEIYQSFAGVVPELAVIAKRIIDLCVPSICYAKHFDDYHRLQAAERAEYILDEIGYVQFVASIIGHNKHEDAKLRRVPVAAAMYGTYHKAQKDSFTFWKEVYDETGATPDSPSRKLAKFLVRHPIRKGGGTGTEHAIPNREYYVKCLRAWNAWRRSEATNLNYYPEAEIPAIR